MRTNKKLITTLALFVMLLIASIFCMNVFAESAKSAKSDESAKSSESSESSEAEEPSVDSNQTIVSGCDLKKEELQMASVKMADFKMLVPKGNVLSIESPAEVFAASDFDRSTLINEKVFFYFNNNKDNYCQIYAGIEEIAPLDAYYSDYSKLTKSQQDELIAQNVNAGDTTSKASFEKINGRTYLMVSRTDTDSSTGNKYVVYGLYTVIGSYKYIIQIVVINPNKSDLNVVNEILNSIKLGGISAPVSVVEIALIVCVAILLVAVAFAVFTLYRIDRFVKSGSALKSVFGFDLPAVNVPEEEDADEDDGDYDEFEDENDEETQVLDSDEKIVDDESDSE